jgi:hypothetical protein
MNKELREKLAGQVALRTLRHLVGVVDARELADVLREGAQDVVMDGVRKGTISSPLDLDGEIKKYHTLTVDEVLKGGIR